MIDGVQVGGVAVSATPVQVSRSTPPASDQRSESDSCAVEANATNRPSCEIAGCMLVPSAGVTPSGVEMRLVTGAQVLPTTPSVVTHVLRSKTSLRPLGLEPGKRFDAVETKETNSPSSVMEGCELAPSPAAVPSGATLRRKVVGVQPPRVSGGTTVQVS